MMNTENLTGYASIDKPWLKFYKHGIEKEPEPKMSAYDYVFSNSASYSDVCAINYFNKRISYKTMKKMWIPS